MKIEEAQKFVAAELTRIEAANPVGILQPWHRDACPDALEHWGRVQQRIALGRANPQGKACCRDLDLVLPARTEAQKVAADASRERLRGLGEKKILHGERGDIAASL